MKKPIIKPNTLMLVSAWETSKLKVEAIKEWVQDILNSEVIHMNQPMKQFADGSWNVEFDQSVRWKILYIYADCFDLTWPWDLNSKYMLYQHIINAATHNWAKSVNVVYPCYPYARSDRPDDPWLSPNAKRVSVMAQRVLRDLEFEHVKRVITLDIHNSAVLWWEQNIERINLSYWRLVENAIDGMDRSNIEVWSTDEGWTKKIWKLAKQLWLNNYWASKERDNTIPNSVKQVFIQERFAKITGKDIVIYDDMIDTAWTIVEIVKKLSERKPRSIKVVSTHGMFNGEALNRLKGLMDEWLITEVVVSDSINRENLPAFIKILPTAELFAQTIASLIKEESVSMNGK